MIYELSGSLTQDEEELSDSLGVLGDITGVLDGIAMPMTTMPCRNRKDKTDCMVEQSLK